MPSGEWVATGSGPRIRRADRARALLP